jgi:hypothetical protein
MPARGSVTTEQDEKGKIDVESAFQALQWFTLAGLACIAIFSAQSRVLSSFLGTFSVGIVTAGSSLVIGSLLGFLFGVPRTLQQDKESPRVSDTTEQVEAVAYRPNTNLEQISDWLTKILVGVGLTQLGQIPTKLQRLAEYIGSGLGNSDVARTFALTIILYFLCCGFLMGYLWTRLYLVGALKKADLGDLVARVDQLDDFKRRAGADATALALALRQLNPGPGIPKVSQDEMNQAILNASPSIAAQVFYQAQQLRQKNWRDQDTKPIMERTIPIFRALVASDREDRFYQNHAELAFALKDQRKPAWMEAASELDKAIAIRGKPDHPGWYIYEVNRAMCRIMLDSRFAEKQPSEPTVRESILNDLRPSMEVDYLTRILRDEPIVQEWLRLNKLDLANL